MKINFLIVICLLFSLTSCWSSKTEKKETLLKVGYPGEWNDLNPSLQHTAYADALMHNQFEPLVVIGRSGAVTAMAAKSWTMSKDKRVFTFDIDTSRKFSNGVSLTAKHFKDSWEYSLTIAPKSDKNSLMDVLYKIEGIENFKTKGEISGVKILSDDSLQITFKESFRMGLSHLAGTRMAAFIKNSERYYGTGPYIINELSKNELLLTKNPHWKEKIPFDMVSVKLVKY
jgi:peptide/nickel transport system substrate-binding protein